MQLKQVLANGKKGALNVGAVLILPEGRFVSLKNLESSALKLVELCEFSSTLRFVSNAIS
ncbi:hypothetical protein IEQ34_023077 [Dendrobium chrysotoxum]|uniref:Cytochrome f large domain-containing protein n=1 Tax=Dendrobium chrysotoxum TaxID=161865 RepID=A0AAV7FZI1_DENCH|nr:hypothetical protein IEQ34_023077 [Dendrobium chrysotoxum]